MRKGEGKFFIKTVYLILVIVAINLFIFQYISLSKRENELVKKVDIKIAAETILDQIVSSEQCLAYEENITARGELIDQVTHKVLDVRKIHEFEKRFSLYEPDCTKDYGYGYYITIEKYNFTRRDKEREDMPPLKEKDVVLILDATKSMDEGGKFTIEKEAAIRFIDCADKENRIGIVVIRDCDNIGVFEKNGERLVKIEGNEEVLKSFISSLSTIGGTDIKNALREAFQILKNSDKPERYKMILLLTDGCESCGVCSNDKNKYIGGSCFYEDYCLSCPPGQNICDFVNTLKDEKIHVFTIGLFTGGCKREEEFGGAQLKCISDLTKGKYYFAASTSRLIPIFCYLGHGAVEAIDQKELWIIGSREHSIEESLKNSFSYSWPVAIRYNETYTQSGRITINLFDGELERLSSIINQACYLEALEDEVTVSYKTYVVNENGYNKVCMSVKGKEVCKTLRCNKNIQFKDLLPGTYRLKISSARDYVRISV